MLGGRGRYANDIILRTDAQQLPNMSQLLTAFLVLCTLTGCVQSLQPWEREINDKLGHVSLPTSTRNQTAQDYFIFGLKLVISFWHDFAEESFRHAQQIDPSFAMAYFGEALCKKWFLWNSEFSDDANAILRRMDENNRVWDAREGRFSPVQLTPSEGMYIEAIRALFLNATADNLQQRNQAFADKMKALHERFPDDNFGASYYAIALLEINEVERAREIVNGVLRKSPDDPAALHFALHAFDFHQEGVAQRGLVAAERYPQVVQFASHGNHMPAHIFMRLGMWQRAVDADDLALRAGDDFTIERKNSSVTYDKWNRYHSLEYLQYYLLQQGRFRKAEEHMERMRTAMQAVPNDRFFRQTWYRMIARQYLESRNYPDMDTKMSTLNFDSPPFVPLTGDMFWSSYTEAGFLQARAMHAMEFNSARALELTDNATARMDELIQETGRTPAWSYVTNAIRVLKLQLSTEREIKNQSGGVADRPLSMHLAASIQDSMVLLATSPTLLFIPTFEFYGDVMMRRGDASAAVAHYSRALRDYPGRSASLLGLGRAYMHLNNTIKALEHYQTLLSDEVWARADDFGAKREAVQVLARLRAMHPTMAPTVAPPNNDLLWVIVVGGIVVGVIIMVVIVAMACMNKTKYRSDLNNLTPSQHKYDVRKQSERLPSYANPAYDNLTHE